MTPTIAIIVLGVLGLLSSLGWANAVLAYRAQISNINDEWDRSVEREVREERDRAKRSYASLWRDFCVVQRDRDRLGRELEDAARRLANQAKTIDDLNDEVEDLVWRDSL